jgi:hypothetical protein
MAARAELVGAIGERYRSSSREERGRILDEFTRLTGYHRKHAIRLLAKEMPPVAPRSGRSQIYGAEIGAALFSLWNLSDRLCSKRLKAMLPHLLPAAVQHGIVADRKDLHELLLKVSPATIDRLLSESRIAANTGRRRRAGMSSAVRREVPVRTFNDWGDPEPGFMEADFVAHGGTSVAGSFIQTLVLTDIATGWTECVPVITRSGALVIEAIRAAMDLAPFPLCGIDFDNDSAFMNDEVVPWCRNNGLVVTRSRAYKKNDQAWVEQKNGAIVRRLVGYGRLEGLGALRCLHRLYAAARLHVNLCQPSFKLRSKKRVGAKIHKVWDKPQTPATRLIGRAGISETVRQRIIALQGCADPVELMRRIREEQKELGRRVDRRGQAVLIADMAPKHMEAAPTAIGIANSRQSEPLHRRAYRRIKPIPIRPSRLEPFVQEIRAWLTIDPTMTALAIGERLAARDGKIVSSRTVQRLVKRIRTELLQSEIAAAAISMVRAA